MSRQSRASFSVTILIASFVAFSAAAQSTDPSPDPSWTERSERCSKDPRVQLGLTTQMACIGADLFFNETFEGNGRTCGSCHPSRNDFTIDPAFIAALPPSDPLFVSETNPELANLEIPELLRSFGLILVNTDGLEDPTHKFTVRSTSHTLSQTVSITAPPQIPGRPIAVDGTNLPPNQRTGWSGDGAPGFGELRDFADGAITQHMTRSLARVSGTDFRLPTDPERDAITAFMLGIGRQQDIALADVQLSDAGAERGRQSFLTGAAQDCNACHDNAGANAIVEDEDTGEVFITNFSFDIAAERARPARVNELGIPFDGGFGRRPFDSNADGVPDAFGNRSFNTAPLIEAADTAPLFHTHGAQTIEDAIRFYTSPAFAMGLASRAPTPTRPNGGPFVLTEGEISDLGRFLRVLNAGFNLQIAVARLDAAQKIHDRHGLRYQSIQRGLLELSLAEIDDALADLENVPNLNRASQLRLRIARTVLGVAVASPFPVLGPTSRVALGQVRNAAAGLGSGLAFTLGNSTVLF
jgi:cytochrome c peroxidase